MFEAPIPSLSLNIKMLEGIWKPDTYFHNGKGSYLHTITLPNKLLRIFQDGRVLYSMRLTIKATCPMLLQNFPMDKQSCPLVLEVMAILWTI
ncbi:gamma-aminobutyric acid receptor alpha-like [Caerostris extrusa]|uniref:Gamma-aminobutyric acid receptor alpha-like n=1 Tax=Caerostris extrusa TaxID=172846 RepID=A0AAV4WEG8_CAEEX|nr:gamma-aminobutyric acid receptor alpha-like [Caerostris extrusa]